MFDERKLSTLGGQLKGGVAYQLFGYLGTDTSAVITAAGYFNEAKESLRKNDVIRVLDMTTASKQMYDVVVTVLGLTGDVEVEQIAGSSSGDHATLLHLAYATSGHTGFAASDNVLTLDNTTAFTPDADYEPATKKYVDDTSSVSDHAKLSHLAYADAGHTGFEPAKGAGDNYVSTAEKTAIGVSSNVLTITKDPTGFLSPADVVINYDPTAQTITLTGTVTAYYRGVVVAALVSGWVSAPHTDTTGHAYFLYYNGAAFVWATDAFPGFDMLLIAIVNYGASNKYAIRECHGLAMDYATHAMLHQTIGTYKVSGGTIPSASYVLSSTTAGDRRPNIDETTITDEDLPTVLPALTSKAYMQYRLGNSAVGTYVADAAEIVALTGNNPYYNTFSTPNWGQTAMPSNSVATVWVYALPVTASAASQKYRYLFVEPQWVTQAAGSSAGQMLTALNAELLRLPSELNLGSLREEAPEMVAIARIAIRYTSNNWSLANVSLLTGNKYSQIGSPTGNFLSAVDTDATMTGAGTASSPLSIGQAVGTTATPTFGDITDSGLTASRAVVTDANKKLVSSGATDTEIGYVSGVTSAIQTQLTAATYPNRTVSIQVIDGATSVTTGDGKAYFMVPAILNGYNLSNVRSYVRTAGVTGDTTISLLNVTDNQEMMSTASTIPSNGQYDTSGTIDTSKDDVVTDDVISVNIDAIASGTAPKGLIVNLTFTKP